MDAKLLLFAKNDFMKYSQKDLEKIAGAIGAKSKNDLAWMAVLKVYTPNKGNMHNGKKQMVLFYADWCPHCKTMMSAWDAFAKNHVGSVKKYESKDTSVMAKYNITSFPTIKMIYEDGTVKEYTGDRSSESFETFFVRG